MQAARRRSVLLSSDIEAHRQAKAYKNERKLQVSSVLNICTLISFTIFYQFLHTVSILRPRLTTVLLYF